MSNPTGFCGNSAEAKLSKAQTPVLTYPQADAQTAD